MAASRRWILYTMVVVAGVAAGGSTVFLAGSAQRRDDRAALIAYEERLLRAVREGGRIVEQEMKPSLTEISGDDVTAGRVAERATGWRRAFELTRADVLRLNPPSFLGDIGRRWAESIDAYLRTVDALVAAARASGPERARLLADAATVGKRAEDLFDRAAALVQLQRRRLGLEPSRNLPDPATRST